MGNGQYYIFMALIFELVGLVLTLMYAGHYVDEKYGTQGLGIALGALVAIAIWFFRLFQALKKADKKNDA